MNEQKIRELMNDIFSKQFIQTYSGGGSYQTDIIHKEGRVVVETIIRTALLDNRDEKIGSLEAKVFMYEQIISKSNFAPLLPSKDEL